MEEYLSVRGTVVTWTDKAVLLSVGIHGRKIWLPFSTLAYEPTWEKGELVELEVKERFLDKAHPWLCRADYETTQEEE